MVVLPVLLVSALTALVVLGWVKILLWPASRRKLVTDWRWFVVLLLFSAMPLTGWGMLLTPSFGTARVLLRVLWVLLAVNVVLTYFIFRPVSRDIRRARLFLKRDDLDRAAAAYQRVLESGRRGERPRAALGLGHVLIRRGDLDDAAAALQWAIDSGSPNIAAMAVYDLGCVLEEQGDIEGARAAYRRAADQGPPGVREKAARALLMLDAPLDGE
jgi:tetratricopeptide (TPR) repeat protein